MIYCIYGPFLHEVRPLLLHELNMNHMFARELDKLKKVKT